MFIFSKISHLQLFLAQNRQKGAQIGFVPTMGALHKGHISLLQKSKRQNTLSVCSIFVNPTQFNNPKDLASYPRHIEQDILLLLQHGCDVLFYPSVDEMYPKDYTPPQVHLGTLDALLEGRHRPGHFNGVVSVVHRLFSIIQPDRAYFGQKDYQQVMVVSQLARQLHPQLEIVAVPTLREENGLAMSSRNLRLTNEQKEKAAIIYQTLLWAKEQLGKLPVEEITATAMQTINRVPDTTVEYFELANADTLNPLEDNITDQKIVALTAVNMFGVRLIDNMVLN